ncbi:rad2 superfamily protein mus201 [Musca autumnalis]|uniref:rad2 superfamily protein mus201 n=1 Tax=Musca autumnalis TaxID=221902 RepID=UPI003CF47E36
MGVTGLWKLIEPCGKPVPVETLEGKILAVDVSIWLHQVVKGFQDNKGAALNNAHLLGLFHRLCKLMYYRVKPVFVFDGCVPQLKRDTIARRQQQRSKLSNEAERIEALLLQSLAKEKVVIQALGPNAELLFSSPTKKKVQNKDDSIDDMFKLPELPEISKKGDKGEDESFEDSFSDSCTTEDYTNTSAEDSSFDESNPRLSYNSNLLALDVRSNTFKQLPADVRHDILIDIKETRKQSSWGRLHELPSRSDDFSTFQMKRLLKRRDVQVCLEEAEKEMGNENALSYTELTKLFSEEGILESDALQKATKQISSSEHTRFLLVRDLKKNNKEEDIKEESIGSDAEKKDETKKEADICTLPSTSKSDLKSEPSTHNKNLGSEYDADLELAIALSLQDNDDRVYDEKDYDYDSDEVIKLNKDQRKQLQNAAKGPARSYMIEYAGMNKEEVQGILEKTQINDNCDETLDIDRLIGDEEKNYEKVSKTECIPNESQEIHLHVSEDSDSTDSDLEEVNDLENKPSISITVDLSKPLPNEDDIFADVFKNDECVIPETPECPNVATEEISNDHRDNLYLDAKLNARKVLKCNDILPNMDAQSTNLIKSSLKSENITEDDECVIPETPPVVKNENVSNTLSNNKFDPPKLVKKEEIMSILNNLKQQAEDVKNINLDAIKLSNSVIELSDDEHMIMKPEVIEICDSDDNQRTSTPPPGEVASEQMCKRNSASKSPRMQTPSKSHAITEFFNVDYVVKRTPDKPVSKEEKEVTPKVKSPFFVRKTPKSGSRSANNSPSPSSKKMSKASKSLFDQTSADPDIDGVKPIENAVATSENIIKEAADLLKSNKTTEELNDIAVNLAKDRRELENERNRQDRMSMSITQRMNSDCQELLKLFGVPYIIAPMEAEAQCAFLDLIELTNGTITDDSDIWLFGGRTVYKNFFDQKKHVLEFRSEQIEKHFNCDRQKLIQLACLVGSDYTTGIHGIGAVTALEILASFASKDKYDSSADSSSRLSAAQNILSTLQKFRSWWQSVKTSAAPPGSSTRAALQKKLKNIDIHEGFPNIAVVEAYLSPKVDENKEPLSWGYPDVESLREFARKTFGWTTNKTNDILMPVMKKLDEKLTQQSIRNYFNVKSTPNVRQLKVSKRIQNAINKMTGVDDSDNTPEKPSKPKRPRQSNKTGTKRKAAAEENVANDVSLTVEPSTSTQVAKGPLKKTIQRPSISYSKEVIPQREKTLQQLEEKKRIAAEILKTSAKENKKKRKA